LIRRAWYGRSTAAPHVRTIDPVKFYLAPRLYLAPILDGAPQKIKRRGMNPAPL
jgi:hypothetical protein